MVSPSAGHVDTAIGNDKPGFLVDLSQVQMSAPDELSRIPICMIGTFYKGKQKFTVSKADVKTMAENFAKRGTGDVVMDYEHASESPEVAMGGPVPAAGWIKSIDAEPDANGIVWASADFTAQARQMIADQQYKYVSPAIDWGARDRKTGDPQGATLTSAALTNRPVLDRMPAIRLSDSEWQAGNNDDQVLDQGIPGEGDANMAGKNTAECVTCGEKMLCPKCDSEKMAASEVVKNVITMSDVRRDAAGRIELSSIRKDALVPFELVTMLEAQRTALSEVDAAVTAGRISPAQKPHFEKIALSDVNTFRELLKTMNQSVDLSEHGLGGDQGAGSGAKGELAKIEAQFDAATRAKMTENPKLQYHEALKLVASEKPELNVRRTKLARKLARSAGEEN
jgi:phage I-like protein